MQESRASVKCMALNIHRQPARRTRCLGCKRSDTLALTQRALLTTHMRNDVRQLSISQNYLRNGRRETNTV